MIENNYVSKCSSKSKTEHSLRTRFTQHKGYMNNKQIKRAKGFHFDLPGQRISDMKVTILEKVEYNTEAYKEERHIINKYI